MTETPWHVAHDRRTKGVYATQEEAVKAAHDLARLMNGVPFGYSFGVEKRLGAFCFVSFSTYPRVKPQ